MNRKRINNMVFISLGAVLMSICSLITVPFVVPFTLQTLGVFLVLLFLGGKRGTISVLVYILLGSFGLPVFAGFGGGFAYLTGPTGGFILGFLAAGLIFTLLETLQKKSFVMLITSLGVSLACCYICGTLWYLIYCNMNGNSVGILSALIVCVAPYIVFDVLKLAVAYLLWKRLNRHIKVER